MAENIFSLENSDDKGLNRGSEELFPGLNESISAAIANAFSDLNLGRQLRGMFAERENNPLDPKIEEPPFEQNKGSGFKVGAQGKNFSANLDIGKLIQLIAGARGRGPSFGPGNFSQAPTGQIANNQFENSNPRELPRARAPQSNQVSSPPNLLSLLGLGG